MLETRNDSGEPIKINIIALRRFYVCYLSSSAMNYVDLILPKEFLESLAWNR